jgi:hypothetical protein
MKWMYVHVPALTNTTASTGASSTHFIQRRRTPTTVPALSESPL